MKNIKIYILSFLLILIVVFVTGCGNKGKLYQNVENNEWLTYEIKEGKLILTDTEGTSPSSKGTVWTYKKDGEGTNLVGKWICEKVVMPDENNTECSSDITISKEGNNYIIVEPEQEYEEEPMSEDQAGEGFTDEELSED